MNILLTGGTGYIGSHTAVVLLEAGHNVVLFDNLANSKEKVVGSIQEITQKEVLFALGDVRDTERVKQVLKEHKIDAVIHFAGLKAVGESAAKPLEYYSNNVQGTVSLLQAMERCSIYKLVFSSSATVYGEPQYVPIDETHPTSATNPYGRTKLHVEEMLSDLAKSDPQWRITCLRYFNPVGAHESGLIGESPLETPNNLLPYIAQVATGQRETLFVYGNDYDTPDGTGVRDYIHVMDLAEGHNAALTFTQKQPGWHAINLGTGHGYSVLEMKNAFEKACGNKICFKVTKRREGDVSTCFADIKLAENILKWKARRGLDEMCKSAYYFEKYLQLD